MSFFQLEFIPAINLDQEFSFQSEVGGKELGKTSQQPQVDKSLRMITSLMMMINFMQVLILIP